ncbi:pre-rRNA-processing protein TSR2 homolog [Abrus precatorius]|uniref:Pre-rRNA-processing protein TSR2 homolog n=1 Tax=Abrus precatorius TaxID=3816 RepID=A0A8B8LQI1_ABRPR|nr:pre-rRNA-processing protein TSR2 homolog [Abrus precatorius]
MENSRRLQEESKSVLSEGIDLVLFRWSALQTAVENEWGGRESRLKAQQLSSHILSWFTQSKEPLYIDDLEEILDQGMLLLNVEVEDGSIEEVAEKLMVMHEECLEGNFKSIETLREANLKQAAHPRAIQIVNDDEDDTDEDGDNDENIIGDNNTAYMNVDTPTSELNSNSVNMQVNEPLPEVAGEADDGWVVVSNRRNKDAGVDFGDFQERIRAAPPSMVKDIYSSKRVAADSAGPAQFRKIPRLRVKDQLQSLAEKQNALHESYIAGVMLLENMLVNIGKRMGMTSNQIYDIQAEDTQYLRSTIFSDLPPFRTDYSTPAEEEDESKEHEESSKEEAADD